MKPQKRISLILASVICLLIVISCTKDDFDVLKPADVEKWTYFSAGYGLPSNKVYCIAEDEFHNIWIGTDKGLVKYDGSNFTTYSTKTGLPSDKIYSLLWHSGSELLVGTSNGFGKITANGKYSNILVTQNFPVIKFSENKKKNYIFCATNIGAIIYDYSDDLWGYEALDSTLLDDGRYYLNPIYDIECDNNNYTWVATPVGVYCFKYPGATTFTNIDLGIPIYSIVSTLFSDKSGNIWIAPSWDEKVIYYNGSKFVNDTIFLGDNNYKAMDQDQYNNYWISIEGHGVLNYGGGMTKVYNTSNSKIISDDINCILNDSKGNIWFGSSDNGLMYYQNIKPLQFNFDSGKSSETNTNPIN